MTLPHELESLKTLDDLCRELDQTAPGFSTNLRAAITKHLVHLRVVLDRPDATREQHLIAAKQARIDLLTLRVAHGAVGEQMAKQEAFFASVAMQAMQVFSDTLYTGLAAFFDGKFQALDQAITQNAKWWTDLEDTGRGLFWLTNKGVETMRKVTSDENLQTLREQTGRVAATGKLGEYIHQGFNKAAELVHNGVHSKRLDADPRKMLERKIDEICPADAVVKGVGAVLEQAEEAYRAYWEAQWKQRVQDVIDGGAAMGKATLAAPVLPTSTVQQVFNATFATGIMGAAVIALGWHTLAYSMINFLPPLAVVALLTTIAVAWWKKDAAREQRVQQARQLMRTYHAQIIMYLDSEKQESHDGKTVQQLIAGHSQGMARRLADEWAKARFGGLTQVQHQKVVDMLDKYGLLIASFEAIRA